MKLLFDGTILYWGLKDNKARTGIYWTARNILQELSKRSNIQVYLYLDKNSYEHNKELLTDLKDIYIKNVLCDNSDLTQIDAFFSPVFPKPSCVKKYPHITVYTLLYDVIELLFPNYFGNISEWFGKLITSFTKDDFYFSISNHTKTDFLNYFPQLQPEQITPSLLATNLAYHCNKDKETLRKTCEKYYIPTDKKYLFSLCSLEPRKNLIRAVKTFIEFIDKNKIDDLVYVLGGNAWNGFIERLEKELPKYQNYKDKIIRAGYVADEDLEVLYSNAEWFIYTSQYEGFGIPPLEAMACGCPVVASNNSSLPEVIDDAGIMIDWDSDEQHIKAYETYYFDKKYREKMAQKGLKRSKRFSWKKTVDTILNKIHEVEERKKKHPLVSIITPTFNLIKQNRKKTFIQSVTSAHTQTYKNIEHIIIDGASNDGTLDLLKKYQKKGWITYYSEPDKGLYDAINKGIMKAKGKYVVVLNSDDFYCDEHGLEWLVKKAEEEQADACCAGAKAVDAKTMAVKGIWSCYQTRSLIFGLHACHQTFLIKTDVMKELGLYDLDYKVSADTAFMYKMLQANKHISMIEPLIITYRLGGVSADATAVKADVTRALFQNYGQYHHLTMIDAQNLVHYSFLNMPQNQALDLGSRLEKPEWRYEFFERLMQHHIETVKMMLGQSVNGVNAGLLPHQKMNKKYRLFNIFPIWKTRQYPVKLKGYLFGFIPLVTKKEKNNKCIFKVFGIPFFKIKKNNDESKKTWRFLGLPILKKQTYKLEKPACCYRINDQYVHQLTLFHIPIGRKIKKKIPNTIVYNFNMMNPNIELMGFFDTEDWGVWGNGKQHSIRFFNYSHQDLEFNLNIFLCDKHPSLKTAVFANGKKQATWLFELGKPYPKTVLKVNQFQENIITFRVENPVAPKDVMDTPDTRLLGIGIKQMLLINHSEKGVDNEV